MLAIGPTESRHSAEEDGAELQVPVQTDPSSPEGVLFTDNQAEGDPLEGVRRCRGRCLES